MFIIYLPQILGGISLLLAFHMPLALLLLGPVVVNIALFHLFLDLKGLLLPVVMGILAAFLLWAYWPGFAPIVY